MAYQSCNRQSSSGSFSTGISSRALCDFIPLKETLSFDPFGGRGTVGHVALTHERHFLLCEKEPEYVERAKKLLDVALFTHVKPRALSITELESVLTYTRT